MSTPAYVDSKTITLVNRAQSSRVPVPLRDDPYVAVRQAQLVDTESEPDEAPLGAKELQSLGSRVPLIVRSLRLLSRQPAISSGHSARVAEAMDLSNSVFEVRILMRMGRIRVRMRMMRERSENEGPGLEGSEEEVVPEGQYQAAPAVDTAVVYKDRGAVRALWEHTLGSHSAFGRTATTLFVYIDRDVRELYTRSGAVRDEIFSQRYKFRSLEREQERVAVTFRALWRLVLASEA
nr:hypothetical protein [Tanacetum cinerariifolium]